jgi:hypothetical protein|tara:strand:+ start:892 stop:2949 length:2058 start_codon:yes stop_codon:yes gene_type:complete
MPYETKYDGDEDDVVQEALEAFDDCEEAEDENRKRALYDLRFGRLGEQWDQVDLDARERDGRPSLTVNKMPGFIRQVVNDGRMNRPAIKVMPVDDDADPDTAEVLAGIVRNIEVTSNADVSYDHALDCAASANIGFFRIDIDYAHDDTFDQDLRINMIENPFSVYGDIQSKRFDSTDWDKAFVTEMLTEDEFEAAYPDADPVDWEADFTDERYRRWVEKDAIRVAEYWRRTEVEEELVMLSDGTVLRSSVYEEHKGQFDAAFLTVERSRPLKTHKVEQFLLSATEILEYTAWPGRFIPIIPVYGDTVNVEGERHLFSLTHFAQDSQRMYNYWRSSMTEQVALQPRVPYIGPTGAFDSDERWATANNENHPYLEYDGEVPPGRQPPPTVTPGAQQEVLMSADDMKSATGLFDASLGARSNETSGRAIMARQREGDVSNFHFLDNLSRGVKNAGVVLLDLIPHVWNQARVARLVGEDRHTVQTVRVNEPFEEGGVEKIYDLTVGKYDVSVKAGPSFTTRREEAATQMIELLRNFPDAAPYIGDILADSLDWPRADDIARRLKTLLPPHLQQDEEGEEQDPRIAELHGQLEQGIQMFRQLEAEYGNAMETIEQLKRDKQLEADKVEVDRKRVGVDMYKAKTDRMAAESEARKDEAEAAKTLQEARNEGLQLSLGQGQPTPVLSTLEDA